MQKYANVTVSLSNCSGNAYEIMGTVTRAMREAHISAAEQSAFRREAMSGDYDQLLQTCMRWVKVE